MCFAITTYLSEPLLLIFSYILWPLQNNCQLHSFFIRTAQAFSELYILRRTAPDWKVCFLRAEDIFRHQICTLGKTVLTSPPHMKWFIFQAYFSNSARLIGCCAHGSLLARGRSSVRTTYFPVWELHTKIPYKHVVATNGTSLSSFKDLATANHRTGFLYCPR